jgi:hypothetical protein
MTNKPTPTILILDRKEMTRPKYRFYYMEEEEESKSTSNLHTNI